MPVLDAKALETDPKGMAFLKSVLRQSPTGSKPPPKESSRMGRIRFHIFKRSRELLTNRL
jgi:hypothetical protein